MGVPAHLMAKLYSGTTYMCCFDGSFPQHGSSKNGGAGSCMFRIRTNGCKAVHLQAFDKKVFLLNSTVDMAEYAGLLSGVMTFEEALPQLSLRPSLLLVEGDSKFIIDHVRCGLARRSMGFKIKHDPSLQPIFDQVLETLWSLESGGISVCLRHRERRFNKVADRLAREARQEHVGNFHHRLLESERCSSTEGRDV